MKVILCESKEIAPQNFFSYSMVGKYDTAFVANLVIYPALTEKIFKIG